MSSPMQLPPAWQFVIDHQRLIGAATSTMCPSGVDPDDFQQDLVLRVQRRFHSYKPHLSAPSTWIYQQARAVRTDGLRHGEAKRKVRDAAELLVDFTPPPPSAERRAEVALLVRGSEVHHHEAMSTVVAGLNRYEVRAELGVSYQARDGRLKRLANRFPDYRTVAA